MVRILHWSASQALTAALEDMELTPAQGGIMGYLAHRDQAPCPRDIEAAFHLSHPTVSGLLSRLEQKDFIELRTDPDDHRCKRIYTRPRGQACHARMHSLIMDNEQRMVRNFTPEEQAQFTSLLLRAIENMGGCAPESKEDF